MSENTLPEDQNADSDSHSDATPKIAIGQLQLDRVSCAVCFREVPLSEAFVPEAIDYVIYFCGLDCYENWPGQSDGD
jgi:hypothetical protein